MNRSPLNRVGFPKRLAAFILDVVFIFVLSYVFQLGLALGLDQLLDMEFGRKVLFSYGNLEITSYNFGEIFLYVFYGLIEGITGASPGKRLLNMKIAWETGERGTLLLFLKRYFAKNIAYIFSFLAYYSQFETTLTIFSVFFALVFVIGCMLVLSPGRQALHDIVAKSAVFKKYDIVGPVVQPIVQNEVLIKS